MAKITKHILLLIVFITGACVLIIEVTALRILSPYFGNTIYSASSVIGVILAALSFGYYFGGKYADRTPKETHFYGIIFLGGLTTLAIELLSVVILERFAYHLSLQWGPLFYSVLLFALPGYLLGMLSPFAIKLQELKFPKVGIGTLSGQVFFFSTLGSITGSFLAGFYLIPNFGIRSIVIGTGTALSLIGMLALLKYFKKGRKVNILVVLFAFIFASSVSLSQLFVEPNVIYSKDGVYEKLIIKDEEYKGRLARRFFQDRSSSSAVYLDTGELAYEYTRHYELYRLVKPGAVNALVLGGGTYTIPKALVDEDTYIYVDVVEIEPSLFELAQEYFDVKNDGRISNFIEDGRRFLHDSEKSYDVIFSDVFFSIASIPVHFTTQEFFEMAREKLAEDGVFLANVIGALSDDRPNFLLSEMNTFRSVFPNSYFFALDSKDSKHRQNVVFMGIKGDADIDFDGLADSDNEIFAALETKLVDTESLNFEGQLIFTDDYAPVETLTIKMLEKE